MQYHQRLWAAAGTAGDARRNCTMVEQGGKKHLAAYGESTDMRLGSRQGSTRLHHISILYNI